MSEFVFKSHYWFVLSGLFTLLVSCHSSNASDERPPVTSDGHCIYQATADYATLSRERALHFVGLGSSTTQGVGASSTEKGWVSVFTRDLRARGLNITVENMGVGGDTTAQEAARLRKRGTQGIDLLLLQPLSNDVLRGTSAAQMQHDLDELAGVAGSTPAVVLSLQNFGSRETSLPQKAPAQVLLKKWSKTHGYPFLDRDSQVQATGNVEAYLIADQVHPNDAGHALIAQCVEDSLFRRTS